MNKIRTRIALFALTLTAASTLVALTGCQTVKGAGKDIQYAGEKTEEAIIKSQNK
jgi:predicted small secreted protein